MLVLVILVAMSLLKKIMYLKHVYLIRYELVCPSSILHSLVSTENTCSVFNSFQPYKSLNIQVFLDMHVHSSLANHMIDAFGTPLYDTDKLYTGQVKNNLVMFTSNTRLALDILNVCNTTKILLVFLPGTWFTNTSINKLSRFSVPFLLCEKQTKNESVVQFYTVLKENNRRVSLLTVKNNISFHQPIISYVNHVFH